MSTYSVGSALVINSFISLFNLIFTLWVSYFLSFSNNRGGEGSTENVTDLPKITAIGSATIQILVTENLTTGPSCCYLTFRELVLVKELAHGQVKKASELSGEERHSGETLPLVSGSQALKRVGSGQHGLLMGVDSSWYPSFHLMRDNREQREQGKEQILKIPTLENI